MLADALELFSRLTTQWFLQTFGAPTKIQEETWPATATGCSALASAPTRTGRVLSTFFVFINRLNAMAREGRLREELCLIYASPLESLAGGARENLCHPPDGVCQETELMGKGKMSDGLQMAIRTRNTPRKDRQRMVRYPSHILTITLESLYLMFTSKTEQTVLRMAKVVIVDEFHTLVDTKGGAYLMLSIARLD